MKSVRKIMSLLLVVCVAFACFTVSVHAASFDETSFIEYVTSELENRNKNINIEGYKISKTEVASLYDYLEAYVPEIFVADSYKTYSLCNYYVRIEVSYKYGKAKTREMIEEFKTNEDYLLRDLDGSGLTDEDKVMLVHDRLIAWCSYDYENYEKGTIPDVSYTSYGAIVNHITVCAGYARAMCCLLYKLGISCEYISSDDINHAWNIVTIGNERYHIDATWDDWDRFNIYGYVEHSNLLCSTETFVKLEHEGSDFDDSPVDTKYDSYWWDNSVTEIQYFNSALYYINYYTGDIVKRVNGIETTVYTITDKWTDEIVGGYCPQCYARLCSGGDCLYFNTADEIYSIDAYGNVKMLFSLQVPEYCHIYGFEVTASQINVLYMDKQSCNPEYKIYKSYSYCSGSDAPSGSVASESDEDSDESILSEIFAFFDGLIDAFILWVSEF